MLEGSDSPKKTPPTPPETGNETARKTVDDKKKSEAGDRSDHASGRSTPVTHRKTTPSMPESRQTDISEPKESLSESDKRSLIHDAITSFISTPEGFQPNPSLSRDQQIIQYRNATGFFYAFDQYKELYRSLELFTTHKSFHKLPETEQINIYLTLLVLKRRTDSGEIAESFVHKLLSFSDEALSDHTATLHLYKTLSHKTWTRDDYEAVQELYRLAKKTRFAPAMWLLTKESIRPGGSPALSPYHTLDLLSDPPDFDITSQLVQCLTQSSEDIGLIKSAPLPETNVTEYFQAMWVFSKLLVKGSHNAITGPEGSIPEQTQRAFMAMLHASRFSYRAGGDEEARKKALSYQRQVKMLSGGPTIFDTLPERLKSFINKFTEVSTQWSPYQKSIGHLIMGIYFKHQFIMGKSSPIRCAIHLMAATREGHFPLLNLNSAELMIAFAKYQHAATCLRGLLTLDLPESLRTHVENQLELCELQLDAPPPSGETEKATKPSAATPVEIPEMEPEIKKSSSGKSKKKKSAKKGKKPKRKQPQTKKKPRQQEEPQATRTSSPEDSHSDTERSVKTPSPAPAPVMSVEPEVLRVPEDKPSLRGMPAKRTPKPPRASSGKRPLNFPPRGGWLPDHHPMIQEFNANVYWFRTSFDLDGEREYIQSWLNDPALEAVHGRICEEMAWFYIRHHNAPETLASVKNSGGRDNQNLLQQAGNYICQALACYCQTTIPVHLTPDVLETLIGNIQREKPELMSNPEFRLRLRAACSTLGHIHSTLAMSQKGKSSLTHTHLARDFYRLKHKADPDYQQPSIRVRPESGKIAVISQEEVTRQKQAMKK